MTESRLPEGLARLVSHAAAPRPASAPEARIREAYRSPLEDALDVVGDRRRMLIVWHLFWGPRPFCDLMRTQGITRKGLREALAEMESRGLVRRDVRFGAVRKADYSLTPLGETLKPIVASLYEWGLHLRRSGIRAAPVSGAGQTGD